MERQSLAIRDIFSEHAGKLELQIMYMTLISQI